MINRWAVCCKRGEVNKFWWNELRIQSLEYSKEKGNNFNEITTCVFRINLFLPSHPSRNNWGQDFNYHELLHLGKKEFQIISQEASGVEMKGGKEKVSK